MIRRILAVVIVASFTTNQAIPGSAEDANETYLLKYKFEPNQFVHYDVAHSQTYTHQKAEHRLKATTESKARKHYRVVSVSPDGVATLEPVIDHVVMSAREDNKTPLVWNSDNGPENCPAQFRATAERIGKPQVRMQFASSGELLSVVPLNTTPVSASPEANFLLEFPSTAIPVGHVWSDEFSVDVNVTQTLKKPVTISRKYRLVSVEGSQAVIELKSTLLTPVREPEILAQLIQRTPQGTIVFDLDRGVLVSRELAIDKREVGALGDQSFLRVVSTYSERLSER